MTHGHHGLACGRRWRGERPRARNTVFCERWEKNNPQTTRHRWPLFSSSRTGAREGACARDHTQHQTMPSRSPARRGSRDRSRSASSRSFSSSRSRSYSRSRSRSRSRGGARSPPRRGRSPAAPPRKPRDAPSPSRRLRFSNLTRNVRGAHVRELAARWGGVADVSLGTDGRLGIPSGWCDLTAASCAAAAAITRALDGGQLDGNVIKVAPAPPPRPPARDGWRGGGGDRGRRGGWGGGRRQGEWRPRPRSRSRG